MKKSGIIALVVAGILLVVAGVFVGARLDMGKGQISSRIVGFPQSFADLSANVTPAVVNISTTTTVRVPGNPFRHFFGPDDGGPFGEFFRKYDGDIPDRELKQQSLGSGFIFDKSGFIITNNHVVEKADEIKVKLADGREFTAKVVGRDPKTDLALIKISSLFKDLPTLPLGDSDKMRVGDWVLAIGNPFGLEHTVTQGIISAKGRVIGSGPYDNFIQTDAPINPGNSGGPLMNLHGEVIGINSAIIASGQGIGFAIPSNMAKSVISQLKEKGKVVRGWIGVSIQSLTPELSQSLGLKQTEGALVGDIVQGGPADAAGIKRGDVIVSFNGKPVKNVSSLSRAVAEAGVGQAVEVKVARGGKELPLRITVQEMTEERMSPRAFQPRSELGITVENITPQIANQLRLRDRNGVVVMEIEPGSPAESAGMQPGDVIREVNRTPVRNLNEYHSAMAKAGKDAPVLFLIRRGEQTFYLSLRVS